MCFSFSHSHTGKGLELARCLPAFRSNMGFSIFPSDSLAHEGDHPSNPMTTGQPALKPESWPTPCILSNVMVNCKIKHLLNRLNRDQRVEYSYLAFDFLLSKTLTFAFYLFCLSFSSSQNHPLIFVLLSLLSPHLSSHHRALITHFSLCDCSYSFSSLALSPSPFNPRVKIECHSYYH